MNNTVKSIKNWLKNHWQEFAVALLAICFFVALSTLNFYSKGGDFVKWSSPDETANYTFAKLYGQTGELSLFEKYNFYIGDVIRPRSMRSDYGSIKPVSFLGIILIYGKIVSYTSYKILPFLTPFFAALGIFFYYLLIKKLMGKTNAFLSTFLLAFFPVWIYYSARSMFHNVLFMSLLIIGLYFSTVMGQRVKKVKFFNFNPIKINWKGFISAALAGVVIGFAIITRTSELLWLAPMLFILWIFNIKKVGILKLLIFISFLFTAMLPALSWNQILYSGFTNGGYPEMNQSIKELAGASSDLVKTTAFGKFGYIIETLTRIKDQIFYFGFNLKQSEKMLFYYFVDMFPYIFWMSLLGFFLFLQRIKKWQSRHFAYIFSFAIVSIILVLYYGSWEFYDNPDKTSHTIGNSYTRYWLPIYLGAFPLVSFFISKLSEAFFKKEIEGEFVEVKVKKNKLLSFFHPSLPKREFLARSTQAIAIIVISFLSLSFVLYGSNEGIVYLNQNDYLKEQQHKVLELTESNSVIITQYHDKILFPERKVIVGLLTDENMNITYGKLIDFLPLYYYNFTFPEKDFNYLNNSKLKKHGFMIEEIAKINESFTLYKLKR